MVTLQVVMVGDIEAEEFLQVTGKYNYIEYKNYLTKIGLGDKYTNENSLSDGDFNALVSGMWFYKTFVLDKIPINKDTNVNNVTRRINRGATANSKKARKDFLEKIKTNIKC